MPIRKSVTRAEYRAAIKPLLDLLGTSDRHIYARPGILITGDKIMLTVAAAHEVTPPRPDAVDPDDQPRPVSTRVSKALLDFPAVQEGAEFEELSIAITVNIDGLEGA